MIGSNAGANKISGFDMCFGFCFAHGGIVAEAIDAGAIDPPKSESSLGV